MKSLLRPLLGLVLLLSMVRVQGQDDIDEFLRANLGDAGTLTLNYTSPLIKSFGFGFNNAWYQTAKPHNKGFDLTLSVSAVLVPDDEKYTEFNNSDFSDLELLSPSDQRVPTVFGSEDIEPRYRVTSTGTTFTGPPGNSLKEEVGFDAVPVPMVQLGIGVIPNTDIKLRYLPPTDVDDDVEVRLWGVGLMHRLNDYFPFGDQLLVDISLFGGYTQAHSEIDVSGNFPGNNQIGEYDTRAWTLEGVVSYDLKIVTFFGALGYNKIDSDLRLLGTYEIDNETLIDPVDESLNAEGPKATAGIRLKLGFVAIHGAFSLNKYHALTAGIGLDLN